MIRPLDGPRLAAARGAPPTGLVIFVHGYGSNGADLIGLAPMLAESLPDIAFVAPNAPEPVPGARDGFQWFGLTRLDPVMMAHGARAAAGPLDRFIDAELARHRLPATACALVGFSQGAMMSLHVGPRRTAQLAAVIAFSGALTEPERLVAELRSRPPTLLLHGERDDVVPVDALAAARAALAQAGTGCRWRISAGLGHAIDEAGIAVAARFLRDAFAGRLTGWSGPEGR